jgi:ligand-binding SRPBCC domain-containing protein
MKVYHIKLKQFLPLSLDEAWDFFSSPENLVKITPPSMNFRILRISGDGSGMYAGQIISYRIKLLPGINVYWVTEITHVERPYYFMDDQVTGPYTIWKHQHWFREVAGGIEMTDEITYAIPFGFLGRLANYLFVAQQLRIIFKFRHETLRQLFGKRVVA